MKKVLLCLSMLLPIVVLAQELTPGTNITITKSWSEVPDGYTYPMNIYVPPGAAPEGGFPVCILLHGNGGNGAAMVGQFKTFITCHVLVAPSGYEGSWNICDEISKAPDVEMIDELVTDLQSYTNINPNNIRILGSSNGAGLANRIFIENDNVGIDRICAVVSQLNEPQFHLNDFHQPNASTEPTEDYCGYGSVAQPLNSRKYLSVCNHNDSIIPYEGGSSVVGVDFLAAEDAIFEIAKHNGYTGNQLPETGVPFGSPGNLEFSYLSGDVVHIKGDAMHATNESQRTYIKDFLGDCVSTTSLTEIEGKSIKIFPNPSPSIFILERSNNEPIVYSVYNVLGELVAHHSSLEERILIDLSSFADNIYFLKIDNQIFKLVKKS